MVKICFLSRLTLILLLLPFNVYSWERVAIPDYVNKDSQSPWNFFDDFEGNSFFSKYVINDKGSGRKPFKLRKERNGNTYIEVTVKHGWNKCCGSWINTERAEFSPPLKNALNKEIWYGFRLRLPNNFQHIDDRILISQFKNQFQSMKKSPLVGISFYENGNLFDIGGDTGGIANIAYNQKEDKRHGIRIKYKKFRDEWFAYNEKKRTTDKTYQYFKLTDHKSFDSTENGEWINFKIGVLNSKHKNGFVKVYVDDKLVFNYEGVTFDWNGTYIGSAVRLGPYRDSDPKRKGYHPQSIHYDDFAIVSDKKTLDFLMGKKSLEHAFKREFISLNKNDRRKVQVSLQEFGYTSKIDGLWGNNTWNSMKKYLEETQVKKEGDPSSLLMSLIN